MQSVERAGPEAITVFKQRRVASGCGASGGRDHTRNQAPFYEFATKIKEKETRAKCHSPHILTTMFIAPKDRRKKKKKHANVLTERERERRVHVESSGGGARLTDQFDLLELKWKKEEGGVAG